MLFFPNIPYIVAKTQLIKYVEIKLFSGCELYMCWQEPVPAVNLIAAGTVSGELRLDKAAAYT